MKKVLWIRCNSPPTPLLKREGRRKENLMSDVVIKVESLSKEYRLGVVGHDTLYRDLQSWWARIRGKEDPNSLLTTHRQVLSSGKQEEEQELKKHFLALNNVSFEVRQGEALGIIGRNGAGKSTLLKILSRITSPSAGSIKIKGRLSSLLEVGTGFHSELTGRENVYMNGAILGMRRREIAGKMDEIIAFSGVEKFIDTPVKRYSSGMLVRLAFSVAANLDAEILVIDEVLAVGDAEFQKKCLGKMDDVAKKQGRTVLFVSHNMGAIENLCQKAILLENGSKTMDGEVKTAIDAYLKNKKIEDVGLQERKDRIGNGKIRFSDISFLDEQGKAVSVVSAGDKITIKIKYAVFAELSNNFKVDIGINNKHDVRIVWLSSTMFVNDKSKFSNSEYLEFKIDKLQLAPGKYSLTLFAAESTDEIADWVKDAFSFVVESSDYYKSGKMIPADQGDFLLDYSFFIKNK